MSQTAVPEATILQTLALLDDVFQRYRIQSDSVRRVIAARCWTEEDIISEAIGKYELHEMVSGADAVQSVMYEQPGHALNLHVHLSPEEKNQLTFNNRDVKLVFESGRFMPHALAYAQRLIDTQRCLKYLGRNAGEVLDIGGNYRTHKRAGRMNHSCTLVDSVREVHRQMERDTLLECEFGNMVGINRCTDGAQNCNYKAEQSMSVHAMTAIPWGLWPQIMDRHGLSYHIAVFHYDPLILTNTVGKLEGSNMWFKRDAKTIKFFFEEDSSMGYEHDWDNYKKYLSPWCQFSDKSNFAYIYDIRSVRGGILTAEIFRVAKASIGRQVLKPFHAYVPNETTVQIESVVYDIKSMKDIADPDAYVPITIVIDRDMYKFMHMYGVANDTANPNKPMGLEDFRAMLYVYNHTRKFGEIQISARRKVSGLSASLVTSALYHVIVRDRAILDCKARVVTQELMNVQRANKVNWLKVIALVAITPVAAPLLAAGSAFDYYVEKLDVALRSVATDTSKMVKVTQPESYIKLDNQGYCDRNGYVPNTNFAFPRESAKITDRSENSFTNDDFVKLLTSVIPDCAEDESETAVDSEAPAIIEIGKDLAEPTIGDDSEPEFVGDDVDLDADGDPMKEPVRQVYNSLFQEYRDSVFQHTVRSKEAVVIDKVSELHQDYSQSLNEFAIYSLDVAHGVMARARENCMQLVPGGIPQQRRIESTNQNSDLGVKVFKVHDGLLDLSAAMYGLCVDTHNAHNNTTVAACFRISKTPDGRAARITSNTVSQVYVDSSLKVFNQLKIGQEVKKSMRRGWKPTFKMTLVDGVPGCGKTSEIIEGFDIDCAVVCGVKHSTSDTLSRLLALEKFRDHRVLVQNRVRTVDSVIMHGFTGGGATRILFVDEGLMLFPGQLYAVTERIRPKEVRVLGDSFQIKAIDRSPSLGVLKFPNLRLWSNIEQRDVSRSIPGDVAVILGKIYGRVVKTTSPVRRSLNYIHVPSVEDFRYNTPDPGIAYLSVLTGDKAKLLCTPGFVDGKRLLDQEAKAEVETKFDNKSARVFTVHEAQGQRLDKVQIVRMNPKAASPLESIEHIVVALSRHYLECTYVSVATSDLMSSYFTSVITDEQIDSVMLPPERWLVDKIEKLKKQ